MEAAREPPRKKKDEGRRGKSGKDNRKRKGAAPKVREEPRCEPREKNTADKKRGGEEEEKRTERKSKPT